MTEGVFATADRSYYSIDSILIAQSIAEAHQAVAEVDVLDHDFRVGHREVIVGEIPEALDAHADQTAAQLLGSAAGHFSGSSNLSSNMSFERKDIYFNGKRKVK